MEAKSFGSLELTGRCPVCGAAIGSSARRCARCEVRYHSDCWSYSGGCAVYGCKTAPPPPRPDAAWDFPHSCDAVGRQLVGLGAGFTRDTLALAVGTALGLSFWDTMDARGGVFFLLWFVLGMAYLLCWPSLCDRGVPVTVPHAFFLGPLLYVVVPLEIPALFALTTGLVMIATGAAVRFWAWSPAAARVAAAACAFAAALCYQADGRPVRFWVDRTGPDHPIATAAWPGSPVVLASHTAVHAWRVGSQLERLHEIGLAGYASVDEGRWALGAGRRLSALPGPGAGPRPRPLFTHGELEQLLRDPELGAALGFTRNHGERDRLVVIPWWGPRAPEVAAVVRHGDRLRVIVDLPPVSLPYVNRSPGDGGRRFHRRVVAVPMQPKDVEVVYRAAGAWLVGNRLAMRLSGYDPDAVPGAVAAEPVELDADWMLRRLAPVVELERVTTVLAP